MEGKTPAYRIDGETDPDVWIATHGAVPTNWIPASRWNFAEIVSESTGYRLPTEAQWEYSAKGGDGSPGNYTYSGSDDPDEVAWYSVNSGNRTHTVGQKEPNGLGIYDMSGNVFEWCWDWWGSYKSTAKTDPTGASSGAERVIRGGRWDNSASDVRSVIRSSSNPNNRDGGLGFRLALP